MNKSIHNPRFFWFIFKKSIKSFAKTDGFSLGAALSYYTVFSIAPIFIIAISVAGLIFGAEAVRGQLSSQIEGVLGVQGAEQIENMIASAYKPGSGWLATILATLLLIVGATTVFGQLRSSLNTIWGVIPKPKLGIKKYVLDRVLSFGMIVSIGFLLLVSLIAQSVVVGLSGFLTRAWSDGAVVLLYIVDFILSFGITWLLLALVYKFMSDAKVKWRFVWLGSAVTAILFGLGKYLLGLYIGQTDYSDTYGAAGSLVLLLVWVYYSSQILFFGAKFTQTYTEERGSQIIPNEYSVRREEIVIEGGKKVNTE
ncbi:MAG: YihY/virulence factor BrkB family protein [Flavobacteriales bacterium]|nr:YihY/virulence factor BrkB family protein [Flavobacteriales bacterium]